MKKAVTRTLMLALVCALALLSLTSVAVADSVSFVSPGSVTLSSGNNGIGFAFSPASVSGATPWDDSLNNFVSGNNPFLIGGGIVLNSSGNFTSPSTTVQIGDVENSKTGLFKGNIDFIQISGQGPGSFTIDISLSSISYACTGAPSLGGCQGSGVLSNMALGGQGFLSFSFGFANGPQNMDQLLGIANGSTYSSDGFKGTIDTNGRLLSASIEIDPTPVPEPASLALFGSGLLTCAGFVRRKFRG